MSDERKFKRGILGLRVLAVTLVTLVTLVLTILLMFNVITTSTFVLVFLAWFGITFLFMLALAD